MIDYVLTAMVGINADLFPRILKLYAKSGDRIADVTYGKGVFWKNVDVSQYDFYPSDIQTGVDMRQLPYQDDSFDMVVIDPPYMYNPKQTVKRSLSKPYGLGSASIKTNKDVLDLYKETMHEVQRVLRHGAFMVVKCKDTIESNKQRWNHISVFNIATVLGLYTKDLFVLIQLSRPAIRWPHQIHARKNHSYFWIFQKK